ncbi:unnamed protein product [Musa acuminata subsp. malaccensis]|uniref:(wild Malaysian banana) hypothetical protein n=1 Tax=Musa acuminata subsp. malaccensis TaxID=214687 RepID=A0A804IHQ7_MUSAM|nr:PREDICTED: uncharacterized membrane protein At1g16860-like [Musa acuminata subsp. malaccensis]CAG1851646.1 unnamed protein product [Musa acuminata subsp. malaccensis]
MSVRRTTHQLSSGMIVSGPPEPPKERAPAVGLRAAPYTGGDVRKSGELGKMFDIPPADPGAPSRPVSKSHSGPLARSAPSSGSGPVPRKTSGPLAQIPPTGLITSGPARSSGGQPELSPRPARKNKGEAYGGAVTAPEEEAFAFGVSRVWRWVLVGVFVAGLAAGAFVWVAVGRPEILIGVAALMAAVGVLAVWNWSMGRKEVERFWRCYPNTSIDSRNLPIGKFVKITGHVTCGSIPLESSYRNISRCIYTSTELYEYKHFTWGLKYAERYVADFYISDPDTGTRFLVRAGNGARVTCFVKPATVMEINKDNKELSPDFLSWLTEHNITSGSHIMRLKEGYIKEGNTVSVMGILRKHENLIMIDPPEDIVSTGCQWRRFFFPMSVEGLILIGDERPDEVVYQV